MGPGSGPGGYRYSPPRYPPQSPPSHTPGTPPLAPGMAARWLRELLTAKYMAVGLISVEQLTLRPEISGSGGMTEVYNLVGIGRIINHLLIPGTE